MRRAEEPLRLPKRLLQVVRRLVYPRRCGFCGQLLGEEPCCTRCAAERKSLERSPSRKLDPEKHFLMGLSGASAVYTYTGVVRAGLHRAKYRGAAWAAEEMGCCMAQKLFGSEVQWRMSVPVIGRVPAGDMVCDIILPAPDMGRGRGYNIPTLLARPIAEALGVPCVETLLRSRSSGGHQVGHGRESRLLDPVGRFYVTRPEELEGKRVLFVDDVISTGGTASACAQALLEAGADSVYAVALAASDRKAVSRPAEAETEEEEAPLSQWEEEWE